jgi:hypothetical protein
VTMPEPASPADERDQGRGDPRQQSAEDGHWQASAGLAIGAAGGRSAAEVG